MKYIKGMLCLLSLVLLLTLPACQASGGNGGVEASVPPSQSVEATAAPSQSVEESPAPSQSAAVEEENAAPPAQTQQPVQDETKHSSTGQSSEQNSHTAQAPAPAATPQPTPKATPQPTPEPTPAGKTCYLTIECKTILGRMEDLTPGKESLIPSDGVILKRTAISFQDGETVFDVLCRATKQYGIHLEYEFTPGFGSYYIEGIHNLYEFDCGAGSGWMYYVNSVKPNYGASKYTLSDGDEIQWRYTCDLGFDL